MKFIRREFAMAAVSTTVLMFLVQHHAVGQAPSAPASPVKFTGAVVSVSDENVVLKDRDGKSVTVAMTPGWTVVVERAVDSSALKVGDFVASTNLNIDATSGTSTEVRVLEPGYRPEESTHPIGKPDTSMTHGTIAKINRDSHGLELVVAYPSGSRRLVVPADVKITGYDVRKRRDLTLGSTVTAVTRVGPDGVGRAARLLLGD